MHTAAQLPAADREAGRGGVGFAETPGGLAALSWAVEETAARGPVLIVHAPAAS